MTETAPAFYALGRSGWRAWVTLLHPPYTAWHLSYVVLGGCLAPQVVWGRLGLTVLAFALAMGVGAHALDELNGRPLGTTLSGRALVAAAVASVAAACALGVAVAVRTTPWLLVAIVIGAALVPVYNLELFGGVVHTDLGFALAWGAFPVMTAYFAQTETIRLEAVLAAAWATTLSLAQRSLSTPVRALRRRTAAVAGTIERIDGSREAITEAMLLGPSERALRLLGWSTVLLAAALVALRAW